MEIEVGSWRFEANFSCKRRYATFPVCVPGRAQAGRIARPRLASLQFRHEPPWIMRVRPRALWMSWDEGPGRRTACPQH